MAEHNKPRKGGIEQVDDSEAPVGPSFDVERGSLSPGDGSVESVIDDRASDLRSDLIPDSVERP